MESKALVVVSWVCQVLAAVILLQTLFFKFTGAEESKYIFTVMGMEPWGRYASGVAELIAAALLLIPATAPIGAALAMGVMVGAIASHLTKLGIVVKDDGGLLFALAVTVFLTSLVVLVLRRGALPLVGKTLAEALPLPRIG
ncbi:MAG: DoxX family protein [Phycisphaerales bacterium]|nr:DoxX family protein [Phycisphaerales bacterium]